MAELASCSLQPIPAFVREIATVAEMFVHHTNNLIISVLMVVINFFILHASVSVLKCAMVHCKLTKMHRYYLYDAAPTPTSSYFYLANS